MTRLITDCPACHGDGATPSAGRFLLCAACRGEGCLVLCGPPVPAPEPTGLIALRAVLRDFLRDDYRGRRWPGLEHGKACVGNAILAGIEAAGGERGAELRAALHAAGAPKTEHT